MLRWASIVLSPVLVVGCGLEVVAFLDAPEVPNPTDTFPEYVFEHNTDSDETIFLGFELFYKFYDATPSAYISEYEADLDIITAQFVTSPTTILRQRGFDRVNGDRDAPGNVQLPLLQVPSADRSAPFDVVLRFPGTTGIPDDAQAEYLSFIGDDAVTLYRSAREDSTTFQGFSPAEIELADTDVESTINDTTPIALGLIVLAFGRDTTSFPAPAVYSEPVALGVAPLNE